MRAALELASDAIIGFSDPKLAEKAFPTLCDLLRQKQRDLVMGIDRLLSEAGATVPQIVAITGHTMQSAHRILERYLARTAALSAAAILHFENAPATDCANRLQTGAGTTQKRRMTSI